MLYLLLDSRAGTLCVDSEVTNINLVDEDWERYILLASKSKKEICHHANIGDYGENCIVANELGEVFWEWYMKDGKWICKNK